MTLDKIIIMEINNAETDKKEAFENASALEALEAEHVSAALKTLVIKAQEYGLLQDINLSKFPDLRSVG